MSKNIIHVLVPAEPAPPPMAAWLGRLVGAGYNRVAAQFEDRSAIRASAAARLRAKAAQIAPKQPGVADDLRAVADRSEWDKAS